MDDWKYNAELSQALGSKEWVSAEIRTKAKSYRLSTSDFNFDSKEPVAADIDVCAYGVLLRFEDRTSRKLSVALSPKLLGELIIAYGARAAKAGEEFPFAETARALTRAQTSIVNRERS
ncbi:MAG TPA: hypothetical protein VN718_03590 [Rhizomicrobium sp.]|nr:hypothetical protein [Rhizomicrobium sp.]